ncbi:MAG TPA: hypothetical protein VMU29_00335 [Smithella sp.]|nr:hypothetical protein [Smithella sp.]
MGNGYAGKFLQVDLTNGVCSDFSIEEERLKKFIGGCSLAASLYLERFNLIVRLSAEVGSVRDMKRLREKYYAIRGLNADGIS